jgi:hypothetical protein
MKRHNGIAGQMSVDITDDIGRHYALVGSMYGGPVYLVDETWGQLLVSAPERFGDFGRDPMAYAVNYAAGREVTA